MSLTYEQSAALMTDFGFRGRIKVAALRYADSIQNEAPSVQGHTARYRWAQSAYLNPEQVATQIHPPVVMDPAVQGSGVAIDDAGLQAAVETVVNRFI